jgi:4-amino-4-deoxy-L-arabinose transferase-like glycosyltransferase
MRGAIRELKKIPAHKLAIASIAALGFGFSYLVQPVRDNERAHYDLTRALAEGSPYIDDSYELPQLRTYDSTRFHGHIYATHSPGLAAQSLPPYLALKAAGLETVNPPTKMIWALHLWGVVLPALVLLLLVRRCADRVVAGFGTIAAISLGSSTLVLPFATVFFSHILAAALAFIAFALLVREQERGPSLWLVLAGGLAAGLGFTVEYPLGAVAVALLALVLASRNRVRRVSIYGLAVGAGALPTLVFNVWAFGTPFHLPQEGWHIQGTEPLPGLVGITRPTLDTALRILFYPGGIAPILIPGLVGVALLWRAGARLQASLPVLVAGIFLVFNSASVEPFGGSSPGPRFMIAALPFLALPLAVAYRTLPGATLGLAIGGAAYLVSATLTMPLDAWDGRVTHRLVTGEYVPSIASFVGLDGNGWSLPFLLALGVAAFFAIASTPWRLDLKRDALAGIVTLAGWLILSTNVHTLLKHGATGEMVALAFVAVTAALVALVYRGRSLLHSQSSLVSTDG